MSQSIRPVRLPIVRRAQRGQTLIVALAILFVLLIIGGIFVTMIGRNLTETARSRDDQSAEAFAHAGILYCSSQLETSPEGADWRPTPSTPLGPNNGITDPDYRWLSVGFTRLFFEGGRALVRLVYDPKVDDPRSQYIRIESVGRTGDLNQALDPTVFVQNGNVPRQRRELIAYKQIGLTDYLFFFTNKDRRALNQVLGIPALTNSQGQASQAQQGFNDVSLAIGDPTVLEFQSGLNPNSGSPAGDIIFGAPIYCNGNLQLAGEIHIFESPRGTTAGGGPNVSPESVLVAGSILLAPSSDVNGDNIITSNGDLQVAVNSGMQAGSDKNNLGNVLPSTSPNFSTDMGLIRDASTSPDVNGITRSVPFKDAPVMDGYAEGTSTLRYRVLTRLSGIWQASGSAPANTGFNGWGTGVYVDNNSDLQLETQNANGEYSLRGDWVNPQPGATAQSYWNGPFYRPPGVLIELLGNHIRLTRTDGKVFRKPDGTPMGSGGNVVDIPLSNALRSPNTYTFPDGTSYVLPALDTAGDLPAVQSPQTRDQTPGNFPGDKNSYGVNLVIMAEGNVRVKGVYGVITDSRSSAGDHLSRVHLTIVSGGTAYIDGNIVKGDGYIDNAGNVHPERASTCAILAKDYVCVNTTMFMASANQALSWGSPNFNPPPYFTDIPNQTPFYDPTMSFGVDPATYGTPLYLFTRHASNVEGSSASTAMNLQINPAFDAGNGNSFYNFTNVLGFTALPAAVFPPQTYPLGERYETPPGAFVPDVSQALPGFEQRVFPLTGTGNPFLPGYGVPAGNGNTFPTLFQGPQGVGFDNLFHFTKDTIAAATTASGFSEAEDYMFSAAMVAPLDIRIEALLFAQERSFFVIPGYSFNQDPNDTRFNFMNNPNHNRSIFSAGFGETAGKTPSKDPFPFYGEPLDVRITIFGAITQNYSASSGDQAAWLGQWGYIPSTFGSSGSNIPAMHLLVHDPPGYVPGENVMNDYRTPKEIADGITRGLRFVYDPALCLPYQHASDYLLSDLGGAGNAEKTREYRAVRFKTILPTTPASQQIIQILPSIPNLPVCPGLLYYGPADSPVVP